MLVNLVSIHLKINVSEISSACIIRVDSDDGDRRDIQRIDF
jgi:hypothetical protein